jgi:hypothetical protein
LAVEDPRITLAIAALPIDLLALRFRGRLEQPRDVRRAVGRSLPPGVAVIGTL